MSSTIPKSHPRYESLMLRERIADGYQQGFVHETGLIAHGRGEAFDYLIGEKTNMVADQAAKTAASVLLLAKHPVISVNGNVVALVAKEIVRLSEMIPSFIEVNLFHRTKKRINLLVSQMESAGGSHILGKQAQARIMGLNHDRGRCEEKGIYEADVVLVPLEDGDRCLALRQMGKIVITIDLNPLSRTAQTADITIVDNVVRSIPRISYWIDEMKHASVDELVQLKNDWKNQDALDTILTTICSRFQKD